MARNRRRPPLYEVVSGGRFKGSSDKQLRQQAAEDKQGPAETPARKSVRLWPTKPRFVQFNTGRVEFSLPYQVVVAVVLGIIVLILLAFRVGHWQGRRQGDAYSSDLSRIVPKSEISKLALSETMAKNAPQKQPETPMRVTDLPKTERIKMIEPIRDHVIVIQQNKARADLVPVQEYFAEYGIETQIENEGDWWFLVTKDLYQNPEKEGTDGYNAKRQIIKLGAKYKAPEGYGTFAPHFFSDAYGKRVR